jgi:hypothetical protein
MVSRDEGFVRVSRIVDVLARWQRDDQAEKFILRLALEGVFLRSLIQLASPTGGDSKCR